MSGGPRHDDQPRQLAEAIESVADLYQLNVHLAGGYGNLVLSRWAFRQTHQNFAPATAEEASRAPNSPSSKFPDGPLQLINWHLAWARRSGTGKCGTSWNTTAFANPPTCRL